MFFHPKNLKSENNNPWFKPWFNILLQTQSIVCATVESQCLEYLGYITLLSRSFKSPSKNHLQAPREGLFKHSSMNYSFHMSTCNGSDLGGGIIRTPSLLETSEYL